MNHPRLTDALDRFGRLLPEVVRGVTAEDGRWKPADGAWSILEVVSHLADEEEFDFAVRTRMTLTSPAEPWPPIDPEGWAVERRYNEGDLDEAANRFATLRMESISWLRSLVDPDWEQTYDHPQFGLFRAGDVLASWAAHDCLHLRQISKRMYQLAQRDAGDYSTRYAGDW